MPMIPLPPRTTFELSTSSLNLSALLETPAHFDQIIAALTTMRGLFVDAPAKPLGSSETAIERTPEEIVREMVIEHAPPSLDASALEEAVIVDRIVAAVIAEPPGLRSLENLVEAAWATQVATGSPVRRIRP